MATVLGIGSSLWAVGAVVLLRVVLYPGAAGTPASASLCSSSTVLQPRVR